VVVIILLVFYVSFQYILKMDWVISVELRRPIDLQSYYPGLVSQIF